MDNRSFKNLLFLEFRQAIRNNDCLPITIAAIVKKYTEVSNNNFLFTSSEHMFFCLSPEAVGHAGEALKRVSVFLHEGDFTESLSSDPFFNISKNLKRLGYPRINVKECFVKLEGIANEFNELLDNEYLMGIAVEQQQWRRASIKNM